jgi:hypothetical protein
MRRHPAQAAGAIPPADAFPYVFTNSADFVLAENCKITRHAIAQAQTRACPWRT